MILKISRVFFQENSSNFLDYPFYIIILLIMKRDYIKKSIRGVTFIEVVISLLLLSITIGAMLGAFLIGRVSAARAKHRIVAINLCRDKIESVKALPYDQIGDQAGSEPNLGIDTNLTGARTTTVVGWGAEPAKIEIITTTVAWTEGNIQLEEKIATLISQR